MAFSHISVRISNLGSMLGVSPVAKPLSPFFPLAALFFKELSLPLVLVGLDRLSSTGAPGHDGIPVSVFRVFFDVFCPLLLEELQVYMNGASPSYDLLIGPMYMFPKTKNSVVVSKMRPICVGTICLKGIVTVLLIQIEDSLWQLVHPNQVGSIRGRDMQGLTPPWRVGGVGGLGLCCVTGPPLGLCRGTVRNGSCTRMSSSCVTCVTCATCATMTRSGGEGGLRNITHGL